ncbi:MAG: hypothetical protein DIU69_12210 [Bacillota bacterium]|nr:MAG: hypothetical protein DIU69_12210 [Bacillota bacterium]
MTRRDRQQLEADLQLYPHIPELMREIAEQYGYDLPPPSWSREAPRMSGLNIVNDMTPRQAAQLMRDREYQRLRKLKQAIERLYERLDLRLRRVLELAYWQGYSDKQVARIVAGSQEPVSVRTVQRWREEILAAAYAEFVLSKIPPYEDRPTETAAEERQGA